MSKAAADVVQERQRQINVEGHALTKDDSYAQCELLQAAVMYTAVTALTLTGEPHPPVDEVKELWPWDIQWWKPTTPRRNLVKAAALIIAEIERLDRMTS